MKLQSSPYHGVMMFIWLYWGHIDDPARSISEVGTVTTRAAYLQKALADSVRNCGLPDSQVGKGSLYLRLGVVTQKDEAVCTHEGMFMSESQGEKPKFSQVSSVAATLRRIKGEHVSAHGDYWTKPGQGYASGYEQDVASSGACLDV
jgi:hypothetical protein